MDILRSTTSSLLRDVKLPKKTKSYSPVPHGKIIDLTLETLDKAGIPVLSQSYVAARGGRQAEGKLILAGGDEIMNMELKWQNSYDKSMPLRQAMGTNVIVCGNGMVRGDMGTFKRKHTGTILEEFAESILESIGNATELFKRLKEDAERLRQEEISRRVCAELIGRMHIEKDIITATQVQIIKRELEAPTHDYNAPGTAWELYNYATFSLKEAHPSSDLKQHMQLHDFFTEEFELV